VIGAVLGMINGLLITKGKMAPFIATLATMTVFRGLTLVNPQGRKCNQHRNGWYGNTEKITAPE
jgi:ribose/xylose/arabinose/galactoside ABC-type transport system permease subunit